MNKLRAGEQANHPTPNFDKRNQLIDYFPLRTKLVDTTHISSVFGTAIFNL